MTDSSENDSLENISTPIDDHFYKLAGQEPIRCSLTEYAQNMQSEANRVIKQDTIHNLLVSTIFTGIDHSFGLGEKKLFETIIFGTEENIHPKWQYATWSEAIENHQQLVRIIRENGLDSLKVLIHEKTNHSGFPFERK